MVADLLLTVRVVEKGYSQGSGGVNGATACNHSRLLGSFTLRQKGGERVGPPEVVTKSNSKSPPKPNEGLDGAPLNQS